jgi:polyphosphate kinase 2
VPKQINKRPHVDQEAEDTERSDEAAGKLKEPAGKMPPGKMPPGKMPPGKMPPGKMKEKEYQRELRRLHGELVAMQEWVKATGAKICIVFEGRDTAGKGGTIKAITERVSPRVFRVVALPAPNERERTQMYVQRYLPHLPAGGEVVIFDRSWYNRTGVERVMGFCTPEESERFVRMLPAVEQAMVDSGILLVKYWLEVSQQEQTRRLESRIEDPRKVWKLSDLDLRSYTRWYDYSRARDAMFLATHTAWAPWYVASSDDKKRCRLNVISHLLGVVPYEPLKPRDIKLPRRQGRGDYREPALVAERIPTPFD